MATLDGIDLDFFQERVMLTTDQFAEQTVSDILVEAGFRSFPVAYDVIPRVKMELPNLILGELDALIQGPSSSVGALIAMCPIHCINDDSLVAPAAFKILAVEVKSSVATLLSKIREVDKAADRLKQDLEDVLGMQKSLPYWLLQDVAEPLHKVVFINGGQRSKNFVLHGGESFNDEERRVWHMLLDAKVSLFYKQSFTQEWITDLSNAVEHQGATIERLEALVQSLLDDKEKKKKA